MNVDKLIKIGFTIPTATDMSAFFGNVAYIGNFTAEDLVDGAVVNPKGVEMSSVDSLKEFFKADTQFYKDIETMLTQKGNTNPNQSEMNNVIVFQATGDFGAAFDSLMSVNANFSQVTISSRDSADVEAVAAKCLSNGRLGDFQISDAAVLAKTEGNVALDLAALNNDNVKLSFDKDDTNALAGGIVSIQAGAKLGSTGDIYSTISGVMPQTYTDTEEANLDAQNVCFYSYVNPINGGGVEQYAKKFYFVGNMINGEKAKRRRIRFFLDVQLKAMCLDFLAKKLTYEDLSGTVLESMIKSIFIEGANSGQVARDINGKGNFWIKVLSIDETKTNYNSLYLTQTYKVIGWYVDALTGEKIDIDLFVDPSDAEKNIIEMVGA